MDGRTTLFFGSHVAVGEHEAARRAVGRGTVGGAEVEGLVVLAASLVEDEGEGNGTVGRRMKSNG